MARGNFFSRALQKKWSSLKFKIGGVKRRENMQGFDRRKFLVNGAKVAAGALALSVSAPAIRECWADEIPFIETDCGTAQKAQKKILVAYASQCGSTGGVAEAIGKELCARGAEVDVRLVDNVSDTSGYAAVIVGSAIHSDKWLSQGMEFIDRSKNDLLTKPVAYFLTCLTLCHPSEENLKKAQSFLNPLYDRAPEIKPVETGLFAGKLDYSRLSWMVRMVMKSKMAKKNIEEGDYRDFAAIRDWAGKVHGRLIASSRGHARFSVG